MGSPETENGRNAEREKQHRVRITNPLYLGTCEVTQEQYETVMGESPWIDQPLVYEGENYAASYVS